MTNQEKFHYKNGSIKVTDQFLTTRYKDEALAPIQSVQVGREPLLIAGIVGLSLALFASRWGFLLYWHEQVILTCIGLAIIGAGYSIASLKIGQYMHERTVLWSTIWVINDVRKAIAKAKQSNSDNHSVVMIEEGGNE